MNPMNHSNNTGDGLGLDALDAFPTTPALEFADWGGQAVDSPVAQCSKQAGQAGPFASEAEYRFCKAVADNPMKPSSSYAGLAGISCKTAQPIRSRLIAAGYIRQHVVQTNTRGRSSILLELLPEGKAAVELHEQKAK